MAKEKQEDLGQKDEAAPKTDFVKLVKDATQAQGLSSFVRVNLDEEVSADGLKSLNDEYAGQGYEVFSNGKSVLLLKQ